MYFAAKGGFCDLKRFYDFYNSIHIVSEVAEVVCFFQDCVLGNRTVRNI